MEAIPDLYQEICPRSVHFEVQQDEPRKQIY